MGSVKFSRHIPSFWLYGEHPGHAARDDQLHVEDIPSRSRKYLWRIAAHRHAERCQCVLVTAGTAVAHLDDRRCEVKGPAAMIIPAGTVHGFRFHADTRGYVVTLDLARLLAAAAGAHQRPIETLFAAARVIDLGADPALAARLGQLLENLLQEFQSSDAAAPTGPWLACSVFWILAAQCGSPTAALPNGGDRERLRRFRELVEAGFMRHLTVSSYARQLGLSETSLNRLCRRLAGTTAFDIIQQRLALEARRRLAYAGGSVAGIAAGLGFADPAYFCRFFRRHSGVSPGLFRRNQIGG